MWKQALIIAVAACSTQRASGQSIDLSRHRIVDLTHAFNARTLYWPTSPSVFQLQQIAYGATAGGFFYSAYAFSAPEHGGTHLDAPIHFSSTGNTTDKVPLAQLIAPAIVIDISAQAASSADYRLTEADVLEFERTHGRIAAGTMVLLYTGWGKRWPDARAYFGDDTKGSAAKLHFPSYGADAARLLVQQRQVGALGADVASLDHGPSTDFIVHRIAMGANVPGLENLTNLDQLPRTGAIVIALPMKIEGGSGGPLRAVALVPR
jgi:kynurenine formamidase